MDRYCLTTTKHPANNGGWVRYEDAKLRLLAQGETIKDYEDEIAELKEELSVQKGIQNNFNQLRADAIREMAMKLGNGDDNYWFTVAAINKYADKLEKDDGMV